MRYPSAFSIISAAHFLVSNGEAVNAAIDISSVRPRVFLQFCFLTPKGHLEVRHSLNLQHQGRRKNRGRVRQHRADSKL